MPAKSNFLGLILIMLLPVGANAQLRLYGAPRSSSPPTSAARVMNSPINLPFWDDFSWATSDKPDSLWVNSESVYVNAGNGVKAPSINVATFDGLNGNGVPYKTNPADYLAFGFTDSLTSRPIRLASSVPSVFDRDSVFLSFFYQWSGNGEAPDKRDFLQVELLDNTNKWEVVAKFNANGDLVPDIFYDTMIKINSNKFFHDAFQFRFRSYGRQSGYYDTWNVDYVYLDKSRDRTVLGFPDKAVGSKTGPIFKGNYYSAPNKHFFKDPINNISLPSFYYSNNIGIDFPRTSNYNVDLDISGWRYDGSDTISAKRILNGVLITDPLLHDEKRLIEFGSLPAGLDKYASFDSLLKISLIVQIDTGELDSDVLSKYKTPIKSLPYLINGKAVQHYELSNYYAYDDGTAEATVGAAQSGNQIAVRFDMLSDNKLSTNSQDTINAVQIYFAYHGADNPTSVYLIFLVPDEHGDLKLIYEEPIGSSEQPLNTFVTYKLQQGVIVHDSVPFYVGWREFFANKTARIGFDKSNDTGDHIYVNSNGTWYQNTDVSGSIMLRPVFGKGQIITSASDEHTQPVSFYPNPNHGEFYCTEKVEQLSILTITGQAVPFTLLDDADRKRIQINQPERGMYIVRYRIRNHSGATKIIITD